MLSGEADIPAWKLAEAGLEAGSGTYDGLACNSAVLAASFNFSISASCSLLDLARRF